MLSYRIFLSLQIIFNYIKSGSKSLSFSIMMYSIWFKSSVILWLFWWFCSYSLCGEPWTPQPCLEIRCV